MYKNTSIWTIAKLGLLSSVLVACGANSESLQTPRYIEATIAPPNGESELCSYLLEAKSLSESPVGIGVFFSDGYTGANWLEGNTDFSRAEHAALPDGSCPEIVALEVRVMVDPERMDLSRYTCQRPNIKSPYVQLCTRDEAKSSMENESQRRLNADWSRARRR